MDIESFADRINNSNNVKKWIIGSLLAFFALFLYVGITSDGTPREPKNVSAKPEEYIKTLSTGEEGYLNAGADIPELILTISKEAQDEFTKYSLAKDGYGLSDMITGQRAFVVSTGTKVKIIDIEFAIRQVRVLEGEHTGRLGWVAMEFVTKEK